MADIRMSRLLKTPGQVFNESVSRFDTGTAGIAERCTRDKNNELNLMKLRNQDVVHFTSGA